MLPIVVHPDGRRAAIVGGGSVALRKAQTFAAAGLELIVIAPAIDERLRALLLQTNGSAVERAYATGDLDGAFLAVAATGDDAVDARVVADARERGILVSDATTPERGDFTLPAVARTGDLTVGVDTGGAAPAFAKRIARELREQYGQEYAAAVQTLARMRTYVKTILPLGERGAVLRALAELPVDALAAMNPLDAEHEVEAQIERLHGRGDPHRTNSLVCATRGSALAMTQARMVAARLAECGTATTLLEVKTTGDRVTDRAIADLGDINVFVKELETALRERRADYAVHSCKDLPSDLGTEFALAAISAREDARDAFCSERYATFYDLPEGALVGTSSPRRERQLAALRPDLRYQPIRGNVDTRLRKLREGEFDAIVLAMAGLNRLRARATHTVPFEPDVLVPAAGQGALAVETLAGNGDVASQLRRAINDDAAERCVSCERAALRELRLGCNAPVGVHATIAGDIITVTAAYAQSLPLLRMSLERAARTIDDAQRLGAELGRMLSAQIAESAAPIVVVPRTQERASRVAAALGALGVHVIELRAGDEGPEAAADLLLFPSSGSVAAAETYLARLRGSVRKPVVLAMGPQSGEAARAAGFAPDAVAPEASVDALVRLAQEHLSRR